MKLKILMIICCSFASCALQAIKELPKEKPDMIKKFTLSSSAFMHEGNMPAEYTCDGLNVSPALQWENTPQKTKSFALIVDDPDAPQKTPWVHWILFNIDPSATFLEKNAKTDQFAHGLTDFGNRNYGGPCPPSGTHRYFFKLYALDKKLDLAEGATKAELLQAMEDHVLATAQLIGLYKQKK